MIKLRHKPARWDRLGRKIPPPYILHAWCERCGMALVRDELHPPEVCRVRETNSDVEAPLRKAAEIARDL